MKNVQGALAAAAFGAMSPMAATDLYAGWAVSKLFGRNIKRRYAGTWYGRWGWISWSVIQRVLGVRVEDRLPYEVVPPCIVVANHTTLIDTIAIACLLHTHGQSDIRWVLKEPIRHGALYVGHGCIASESAFVNRDGSPEDLRKIRHCAQAVRQDGASIVLFPEGTRYSTKKAAGSGYDYVLPPHSMGFDVIRQELPDYPILNLTLIWRGVGWQNFANGPLYIDGDLIPARQLCDGWLKSQWQLKDAALRCALSPWIARGYPLSDPSLHP